MSGYIAPMPTATSRIVEILESQPEPNLALKGLLVMRFDPERGVLSERIVAAFETIFEALRGSPRWAYGFWPKPAGGTTRVAQPRDVSGAAGQKWVLGSLRSLRSDSGACLALQDGPKPWGAGSSAVHWVPERYGIHLDVSEEWQPGATLLVAMPLDELHQERSLALADALFDSLQATVGWMSPGLWGAPRSLQHSVVNELEPEVLEQLVAVAPQLDLPIVYFGNTEVSPHDFEIGRASCRERVSVLV